MDEESLEKRLDIFEEQLKRMTQAIITLARVEERQLHHTKELENLYKGQGECFKRLRTVEANLVVNTTKMGTGERFWWILVAAMISTGVGILTYNTFGGK